ncbi:MAG TPA: type 2 lanthipeptide synthetase LanM family protein [Mycobacteriales bacterium]|nr:type 2 lanthipeptide synthetase LanM family protein [Mycobacteriales bacterium]
MDSRVPLDIAGRASNLSERVRIVAALRAADDPPGEGGALDAFSRWKIDKLASKLAEKFHKESLHRSTPARYTRDDLVDILTAYRHYESWLPGAARLAGLLVETHRAWLPTYQAALASFDDTEPDGDACWRRDEAYHGRLAKAAEPFLGWLSRELEEARQGTGGLVDRRVVDDLQEHLLNRFELPLAWAVETDAKVYCAMQGIDPATATATTYLDYLNATFRDGAAYHRFYLTFPVLGRWLAHLARLLADYGREIIEHLAADADAIGEAFFGRRVTAFRSVRPGRSDYHAAARSVAMVDVELAGGGTATFVYKPRCIRAESAMQGLLGRLAADGVVGFATRTVLPRDGYGYEALVPAGRNRVGTRAQVAEVYAELGGYLAIFYVLGGGDLHFENVLVADGHAYVCDCETALGVLPRGQARPPGTLLDSVFRTGLLEWPRGAVAAAGAAPGEMRISGYAGGEGYDLPIPVPQLNDRRGTFGAAVTYRAGVHVEPDRSNRVFLGDRLMQPEDFAGSITAGFGRVYGWFQQQPEEAVSHLAKSFAGASVRFINWGTQVYSQLLMSARHPKCLMEPLEVDLLANTVRTFPRNWDHEGILADRELTSMWRLDVPIFTAPAEGDHLVHDHYGDVPAYLETSPLEHAADRIRWLSEDNRERQGRYIAASLCTAEVSSPAFVAACLDYAVRVGRRLCDLLCDPSAPAPWTSYQLTGDGIVEADVEADLYHGSAGIALFLAYLDHLAPHPDFRQAAERALAHTLDHYDRQRLGVFQGAGGVIYLLLHLHRLWRDDALLDRAVRLSRNLPPLVASDKRFDVLGGSAGLVPVLLALADRTGGQGLDLAHHCAEHLLRCAEADGDALSWPLADPGEAVANLTGFAHGTAGIGWALITLGCRTDRPDYLAAGRQAFAYETRYFDEMEQDWYDLRTSPDGTVRNGRHFANAWCNGAAGIGLSRISSWALLGRDDDLLLREAHQGLATTMRNFPRLMNDTLCHGRAGNAELLLRFARLRDEPAFQLEANVQVQAQWRNLDEAQAGAAASTAGFFPGLMVGMAGFGMHFLRLARPDAVPSVLLLDPPTDT